MNHKIKTFEDACIALDLLQPELVIPDFLSFPSTDRLAMIAHAKLIIIAKALNEGWVPDWSNWDEYKYYPWFDMQPSSGSGFAYGDYDFWSTYSSVGSRLCFKSSELAEYAGKQFEGLYKDYFVIA
jgi:hypothetical protein